MSAFGQEQQPADVSRLRLLLVRCERLRGIALDASLRTSDTQVAGRREWQLAWMGILARRRDRGETQLLAPPELPRFATLVSGANA
jgi:hypothetical protein